MNFLISSNLASVIPCLSSLLLCTSFLDKAYILSAWSGVKRASYVLSSPNFLISSFIFFIAASFCAGVFSLLFSIFSILLSATVIAFESITPDMDILFSPMLFLQALQFFLATPRDLAIPSRTFSVLKTPAFDSSSIWLSLSKKVLVKIPFLPLSNMLFIVPK